VGNTIRNTLLLIICCVRERCYRRNTRNRGCLNLPCPSPETGLKWRAYKLCYRKIIASCIVDGRRVRSNDVRSTRSDIVSTASWRRRRPPSATTAKSRDSRRRKSSTAVLPVSALPRGRVSGGRAAPTTTTTTRRCRATRRHRRACRRRSTLRRRAAAKAREHL